MIVEQDRIDSLFDDVSATLRTSVRQSRDSILRDSHRRLSNNPRDTEAIHVIAASNLRQHNPERSLSILQRDSTTLADNPIGHRLAGYACLAQQQTQAALDHFDQAVRLDPCQADCWTMLGRISEDLGRISDDEERYAWAIEYYQRAMVFHDPRHESALALSRIHARNKNIKEAIHTLRVALLHDQRSPQLNIALAQLLQRRAARLGRRRKRRPQQRLLQEAYRCYRTANSSAPTSSTFVAQGVLEQRLERFEEAKTSFQRAIAMNPGCSIAITHLANANVESGEIDQALQQFESALEIDPKNANTHFRYTRAKRFKAGRKTQQYLTQLAPLADETDRPTPAQVLLNFALAKVLDDTACYDQAWYHYQRANRMKPGHHECSASRNSSDSGASDTQRPKRSPPPPLQQVADNAIRFFTPEFFEATRGIGNPTRTPVFIVGMPRSGTTLTEQILSSHPLIAGAGELRLIDRIRQELIALHQQNVPQQIADANSRIYPDVLARLDQHQCRELADGYLAHIETLRNNETRVTDKMPTNFMHLGLIALLFPGATVIHCRRSPMDVLVSCYCQNLNAPFCDLDQLVLYHRQYRRMMAHWHSVLPLKIHTVDYESLVTDPEPNSRALIEHCGLEWDQQCLEFHANARSVHTPSKWQVRQPMYSSSIEKWRRFEPHLKQIAEQIQLD